MKTSKEWFDTMITGSPDIKEVISEIQREAYNQALEDAAKSAVVYDTVPRVYSSCVVDKQSILKLKK